MLDFSIIIPAYNEEDIIEGSLRILKDFLRKKRMKNFEIIVADDGSKDNTVALAKKSGVRVLKFVHRGRGECVSEAVGRSRGEIVLFMDADLATGLEALPTLVSAIKKGYDIATGSRWLPGAHVQRSLSRLFISLWYNILVRFMFGSRVYDHQCGFKSFRRDVFLELTKEMGLKRNRLWAWDAEILIRAQRKGYKIFEFPVEWKAPEKTTFRLLRDSVVVSTYLLELWLTLHFTRK